MKAVLSVVVLLMLVACTPTTLTKIEDGQVQPVITLTVPSKQEVQSVVCPDAPVCAPLLPWKQYRVTESPGNHVTGGSITIDRQQGKVSFLASGAYTQYVFATNSMLPVFNHHHELVLVPPTRDNVRVGDIIEFRSGTEYKGMNILHRVVNTTSDGKYVTRGDNNPYNDDQQVRFDQIRGVLVAIVY